MIEHDNILYVRDISVIGGVETFVYEMVKKYHKNDIAVVYKTGHINQLKRLRKYCRVYQHTKQQIKCKVAIINYDVSIIDFIDEKADIYQVIHADYENPAYKWLPPTHERIKQYIAITKHIQESFKKITKLQNVEQIYNPLTIDKSKKLVLLSATRLSKIKGKHRMQTLASALDKKGIDYIWYVFTTDRCGIDSDNVVYMTPRLDVCYWYDQADYLVQLSDTEGLSYSINEMLYRNKPVIVTPLPYLEEIGVKDNENAYIMKFDCSNVEEIANKITKIPKFEFKKLKDDYEKIIVKGKSHYQEDLKNTINAICIRSYKDLEHGVFYKKDDEVKNITLDRYEYLKSLNLVK